MTSTLRKSTVRLPRLHMKDELLKTSPDLARYFGEDVAQDESMSFPTTIAPARQASRALNGKNSSPRAFRSAGHIMDTPRMFEDEIPEDEELAIELDEVKKERTVLMQSIAQVKQDAGMAGGEAQQADIKQLMKEMELKKQKLNELKEETRACDGELDYLRNDSSDCRKMMTTDCDSEMGYIQHLKDEMKRLDDELVEAEAKNRLYYLLGERTRRDHMAMEKKVREAREMKKDSKDDIATLTQHMHDMLAAKEEGEKQLSKMRKIYDEARRDWQKKLKDRRKEVRDLKKRQAKEREKDARKRKKQQEREKSEKEMQAKIQMEREAYEMQIQALAPKIEAMEASWNRLRTISGADTPTDVIAYWEGLKAKEESMRELVKLAEKREARAKSEMSQLLESRSEMFETTSSPNEAGEGYGEHETRIEDAQRRMETAKQKFNKLRTLCISSEQGLTSLLNKLMVCLEEAPPSILKTSHITNTSSSTGKQSKSPSKRSTPSSPEGPKSAKEKGARREGDSSIEKQESNADEQVTAADVDEEFFPQLEQMLEQVATRLMKVSELKAQAQEEYKSGEGKTEGDDSEPEEGLMESELALMKGLRRHTWTGAPWLDKISEACDAPIPPPNIKRKKGKHKKDAPHFDLHRILGYAGDDLDQEDDRSDDDSEDGGGVVDRDFIKHRAMKMTLKLEQTRAKE
ncbi:hypothetical protein BSKO_00175 [Bryopsis sp. KO-2023]|nr:hypothetical protein BSKO_00175 [Bryopsis sp. KO-2023]